MPVNLIYKDRSIVPDALAFPGRSGGGAGISGTSTFQSSLQQNVSNYYYTIGADEQKLRGELQKAQTLEHQSERRSKDWVGEYHRAFEWSINQNLRVLTNGTTLIGFNEENVRIMGAEHIDGGLAPGARYWRYKVTQGAEGIYHIHSHLRLNWTDAATVSKINLVFRVNQSIYRAVDAENQITAGHTPLRDAILGGSCMIPLNVGDTLDIAVVCTATLSSFDTLYSPTSIYGYVCGHRVRCDMGGYYNESDGATAPITNNGLSYSFYNG